jgi:chromosome segregation protein
MELLNAQCLEFSRLSNGLIKGDATKSIDIEMLRSVLASAFVGSHIREEKINYVCELISTNSSPLIAWSEVLEELRLLAELKTTDDKRMELPQTPRLLECKFSESNLRRAIEVLTPEKWIEIATLEIEFNPQFYYIPNSQTEDVVPFPEASAGQQATALLAVLLNQPGGTLVIDQPEDDIDNRAIEEIIANIWSAKRNRQLIFSSHNANLVVNGDAELVVCCDYKESNNQTRGIIKTQGAIDLAEVKDEITSVMEGGEKAFKLRYDKYGF